MAHVDLQIASNDNGIPELSLIEQWLTCTLKVCNQSDDKELSIRVVDNKESRALNFQYRGKDKATNVLSFPCELPAQVDLPLLGDLAICAEIVKNEATEQVKSVESHWAHMVVHGTMHLLGYDHVNEGDAEKMEKIEIQILAALGYPSPY